MLCHESGPEKERLFIFFNLVFGEKKPKINCKTLLLLRGRETAKQHATGYRNFFTPNAL
jgi:hypothetical protein